MNENYVKDQTEIDLRQLFWAICRRWRMVLCWMLAAALTAGAFKAVWTVCSQRGAEETAQTQPTGTDILQAQKDALERLSAAGEAIAMREEYEKESLYMAINPYNVAVARQTYYVKTDDPVLPETASETHGYANAVVAAYAEVLTGEEVLRAVAEECGVELRYLSELVEAGGNNAGMLTLRVIAKDLETAEKILRLLDENVDASKERIETAVEAHRITRLSYDAYTTVDMDLAEAQSNRAAALTTRGAEQTKRLEKLEKEYESLEVLAGSTSSAVKSGVKTAILGALLGAVIACCIVCVQAAVSDRLYSAGSLTQRVCLRILGAVPTDPAKISAMGKLDRKLRGKAGLSTATDAAGVYAVAASYLAGAYPEAKTVLVAGGAEEEHIQAACEAFQANLPEKKFLAGGSVLTDADTIRKVGQSDLTVLVEHTGVSSYSGVIREAETVQSLKGTFAGALVIED